MAKYLGDARAGFSATAAGVEARLRVVNDTSGMSDRSGYEANCGTSITFYYKKITTTNPPNKVTIQIRRDNDNTVLQTLLNAGAEPADGASFSYTNASAGPVRLYVQLVKDNSSGNLTDYSVDSDGNFTFGTGLVLPSGIADAGCLRGNALVTALAVSAYPAGSTFAYGVGADEIITLTATHTAPIAGLSASNVRLDAVTAADAQQIAGTTQALDAGTSYTQAFTAASGFANAAASYGARLLPISNAAFVPTSGAILWTKFVASGTATQDGNNVKRSSFYNVDPRITMPTVTPGKSLYNLGQASTIALTVKNARNESLTRSRPFQLKDSLGAVKQAASYTGTPYNVAYTIGTSDDAAANLVGNQWTINTNFSDVTTNPSANAYKVSSKYQGDIQVQLGATLSAESFPFSDTGEDHAFVILGDIAKTWLIVADASGAPVNTASGNRCTLTIKDPDGSIINTILLDTKQDATNGNRDGYTPRASINPGAPAGDWTFQMDVLHNGNTFSRAETVTFITPLTSNLHCLLNGPVVCQPDQTIRVQYRTETDDAANAPQTVPTWKLYSVSGDGKTLAPVTSGTMLNAIDDTATIDGAHYYLDLAVPSDEGRYVLYAKAQLNGNGIRTHQPLRVALNSFDPVGLEGGLS